MDWVDRGQWTVYPLGLSIRDKAQNWMGVAKRCGSFCCPGKPCPGQPFRYNAFKQRRLEAKTVAEERYVEELKNTAKK